jgi:hypothetical protein
MATKAETIADPNSCLNLATADEQIFVLRANDELAAKAVRYWAQLYYDLKNRWPGEIAKQQIDKHREALVCAQLMDEWRRGTIKEGR